MNRFTTFQEWTTIVRTLTVQVGKPGMVVPDELKAAIAELNGACARNAINNQPPEPKKYA